MSALPTATALDGRAMAAGTETKIGCHTLRGDGRRAHLENCGALEHAQQIAAHQSPRETKLYHRLRRLRMAA